MLRIIEENWIKSGIGLIKSLLLRAVNVMQPAYFDRLDK
jgi:regulation of enolase protein 1 (concanavalin A-like superfamily)